MKKAIFPQPLLAMLVFVQSLAQSQPVYWMTPMLDSAQVFRSKPQAKPVVHRDEFPIDNAVVTFP